MFQRFSLLLLINLLTVPFIARSLENKLVMVAFILKEIDRIKANASLKFENKKQKPSNSFKPVKTGGLIEQIVIKWQQK